MTEDELLEIRIVCKLAESIYTAWLGAYYVKANAELVNLCPYPRESLDWYGDCTHDALLEGMHLCVDPAKREELRVRGQQRVKDRRKQNQERMEAEAPGKLAEQRAAHSRQTNAATAIKLGLMSEEELAEWKKRAAARNRKYRANMEGERKEEYQAKGRERTRKRRAAGAYDLEGEEKAAYDKSRRDSYAKKKAALTAEELEAWNVKIREKSKAQREKRKNKGVSDEKGEARPARRQAASAKAKKGATMVDDEDDEEEVRPPTRRSKGKAKAVADTDEEEEAAAEEDKEEEEEIRGPPRRVKRTRTVAADDDSEEEVRAPKRRPGRA